ncbi:MAG TPA: alpha/beta fold hydrolase [Nakamurella sp.]
MPPPAGLDVAGDLWDSPLGPEPHVFPTVAEKTRVCTYDRPGTTRAIEGGGNSRSDPVPQPTTTADGVSELHALTGAPQVADPVVLVGHSYAGMVLVDALAPELRASMSAELVTLVDEAEHVTAHSGHNVMIDDAPAVIGAIDDVVDAVRGGRTTA